MWMTQLPKSSWCNCSSRRRSFKINFEGSFRVLTPHQVQSISDVKGCQYLTDGKLVKYQAFLLKIPAITLKICNV
jgi:hypothetical protein